MKFDIDHFVLIQNRIKSGFLILCSTLESSITILKNTIFMNLHILKFKTKIFICFIGAGYQKSDLASVLYLYKDFIIFRSFVSIQRQFKENEEGF